MEHSLEIVLHGHSHEDDTDRHGHEVLPTSVTRPPLSGQVKVALGPAATVPGLLQPRDFDRPAGQPPDSGAMGPDAFTKHCVLLL